jgi:hypothetical protein
MNQNGMDTPEQVPEFALRKPPRGYGTPVEEAGQAIVAKLQKAADLSNENCDRAMKLAHKLSMELRAAVVPHAHAVKFAFFFPARMRGWPRICPRRQILRQREIWCELIWHQCRRVGK